MVPLSIPGLPPAGNRSSPLWTVPGPWPSAGGLRRRGRVRFGRAGRLDTVPRVGCSVPITPRPACCAHPIFVAPEVALADALCRSVGTETCGEDTPWPRSLCWRKKGGDDDPTGIGAPMEGRGALPLQGHDSTQRRDSMKRVASFLFATLLALSLASAALAQQPGPQPCPGGPPCDGCPGGPHCPPGPPDLTSQPSGLKVARALAPSEGTCPGALTLPQTAQMGR
jgi:hypothetical protein